MKLYELLDDAMAKMPANVKVSNMTAVIKGITDNTENVRSGFIFVCVKGNSFDGHTEAKRMLECGAVCVVADHDTGAKEQIIVSDTRVFFGLLCAAWYGHPERKIHLIGVTGTNGKTTTATLIKYILASTGRKLGFIGTTGVLIDEKPVSSDENTPTTPRVNELYELFNSMIMQKCCAVVMEVSSFALAQNRIGPAIFEIAIFTNLTQDHLDYHGDMESYYQAKKLLFTEHARVAVINIDDYYGKRLYDELKNEVVGKNGILLEVYSYGLHDNANIYGDNIRASGPATKFWISQDNKSFPISLPMIGYYNVENAIAAITAAMKCGISTKEIIRNISGFKGVRGRCEILTSDKGFMVVCDYAHSPDALEKMLPNVKEHTEGRLIVLFGCGGDRDKTKRPLMAAAVERFADMIIVTSDNPRSENPEAIIDDICAGLTDKVPHFRITDRKSAIECAIALADTGDTVVLAGKGHENYQVINGNEHIHFDESEIVHRIMDNYHKENYNPHRHEYLTITEIAAAVCGRIVNTSDLNMKISANAIFSDSRQPIKGGMFVAIRGEKFNGNKFVDSAIRQGAVIAMTDDAISTAYPCIIVRNTRKALLDLARYFRMKFRPVVIGITGSVGKTTTKNMTSLALSGSYGVLRTEGNHNNEIGLPFTLFRLNSTGTAAVIEMGMSGYGEMRRLSEAAVPTICVLTNIGYSHIEKLGSQQGILQAKMEIIMGAERSAPIIINSDDKLLRTIYKLVSDEHPLITYAIDDFEANYSARRIKSSPLGISFALYKDGAFLSEVSLPVPGKHNVYNALAAIAAADTAGADPVLAAKILSCYQPDSLRQNISTINGQTVITDCYNASPTSVKAAIDILKGIKTGENGRRIFVFGDMLELGEDSPLYHSMVGDYAAKNSVDILVCLGELAENAAKRASQLGVTVYSSTSKHSIVEYLRNNLREGDAVLFKASRGMKLEEIISAVYDQH